MIKFEISLLGKSPSSFLSSKAVSNVEETLDYISGSTLRGALAKEWSKTNEFDNTFKAIFTKDFIHFCNLYINGAKPIPLSALSCKYQFGFRGDSDPSRGDYRHGVVDLLLPLIKEKHETLPLKYQKCVECSAPMKKHRGYYDNSHTTVAVSKRLIYHTAISAVSETAAESSLYSLEVIEEGQKFESEILIYDTSLADKIQMLLESQSTLFLGSDKSRGLGRFEIAYCNKVISDDQNEVSALKTRIDTFNEKLGFNDGKIYFSITLQSDAIITDHFMRYKTTIEPVDIGINYSHPVLGIADSRIISGWNSLLKLPKDDDIAILKGSVFVYSVDNLDESTIETLYRLEREGIGKRRSEGFGRLTVCDQFHFIGDEVK